MVTADRTDNASGPKYCIFNLIYNWTQKPIQIICLSLVSIHWFVRVSAKDGPYQHKVSPPL